MKPEISIIVPVYNVEPYIRDCIDSILLQKFRNFEVLLINDGSTDLSGEICEEISILDSRIKVIHKEYGGVSSARNVGIDLAQGEFIGFVDGDDRIDEWMYYKLYQMCIETNSDIGICKLGREINGELINIEENTVTVEMDNLEAMRELFKGKLYRFSLCNKLFRKHCFRNVYFPDGRIHEDLSTTYKLFANSEKATFSNFPGYIYIKRENSILTTTYNKKRLDAFNGWDEIYEFMRKNYPNLTKEVSSCFVYWSIDNVFYIINQVMDINERDNYMKHIQKSFRKKFKYICKVDSFPINYKYYITLLIVNYKLFIMSQNVNSIIKGLKQN